MLFACSGSSSILRGKIESFINGLFFVFLFFRVGSVERLNLCVAPFTLFCSNSIFFLKGVCHFVSCWEMKVLISRKM